MGLNQNDTTDAFVTAMFEDAIISTDVVTDSLSPRWLPWTRRAFIFKISHLTSQLLLGVHDFDSGMMNDHDKAGRVTVSLSSFAPNTEYVLHYKLYDTAVVPNRGGGGTIIIRLVIELHDTRKVFHNSLSLPRFYVNVQDTGNYRGLYYIVEGGKDVHSYNINTIIRQKDELLSSFNIAFDIYNAAIHIIMWKGHVKLRWRKFEALIPLHSIIMFVSGVLLVEKPQLAPAIFTSSIGWVMLALLERRLKRPSKFGRLPSYWESMQSYLSGEISAQSIEPHENEVEDREYEARWKKHRADAQAHVFKLYNEKMKEWEELAKVTDGGVDIKDLTTRSKNIVNTPLKSTIYPYQIWFEQMCHMKRFIGYILEWEHYFLAFWITTVSFGLGFLFLFIPWGFIFRLVGRLFVWIILGPWMKFVNEFYPMKNLALSQREMVKLEMLQEKERIRKKNDAFQLGIKQIQIQKETAVKLGAIKKHVFGRYILSMPHFLKLDLYRDEPLYQSSAKPLSNDQRMALKITDEMRTCVLGQRYVYSFIPGPLCWHPKFFVLFMMFTLRLI